MPDYHSAAQTFLQEEVARVASVRVGRKSNDVVTQIVREVAAAEAAYDPMRVIRAYDAMAGVYPTHILADSSHYVEHLGYACDLIARLRPARIVDAGCGIGIGTVFLARTFPEISFVAYDFAPAAIKDVRERADHYGLQNLRVYVLCHQDAAGTIGYGSADLVIARGSIGYLPSAVPQLDTSADPEGVIRTLFHDDDPLLCEWYGQMQGVCAILRSGGALLDIHGGGDRIVILRHFLYRQFGFFPQVEERRGIVSQSMRRALDRRLPGWGQLIPLPDEIIRLLASATEHLNLYRR